jgi:DNA-binding response OmpR family regulator
MENGSQPAFDLTTSVPGARVLVVDDERTLRTTLSDLLNRVGYQVWSVGCGSDALEIMARQEFDVVLLDLKMPDIDGTDVLREARLHAPQTLFIIMTAYGTLESAIVGIRHGAFDYLLKPSSLQKILETVEAGLTRRWRDHQQMEDDDPITLLERALVHLKSPAEPANQQSEARFLKAAGILVDRQKRLVLVDGEPVHLTATEFDILAYLMRHRDRVISAAELVEHLRGFELDEREASDYLRSHIHRLRQKLDSEADEPRWVKTVRGQGFTFAATQLST